MNPKIIIHGGGGWTGTTEEKKAKLEKAISQITEMAWKMLKDGKKSLDVVEAAVEAMENSGLLNAGLGSCLTKEGKIELEAGIMDGKTLKAGAVIGIKNYKNPVCIARKVLEQEKLVILSGEPAEKFAEEKGFSRVGPDSFVCVESKKVNEHDTVGAVAIDTNGDIAAATSTGGLKGKHPGRVGDSPIIGAGFYADNLSGGASTTGVGEDMLRVLLAKTTCDFAAQGFWAQEACDKAVEVLKKRVNGRGSVIFIDKDGNIGHAMATSNLLYGFMKEEMKEPEALLA